MCGARGRLVVSPHFRWSCSCCWWLFPLLQSDHPDCSCQSLQREQPTRERKTNWKLATKLKVKRLQISLWSIVAAIKTWPETCCLVILFIYLFSAQSFRGRHANTDSFISHTLIKVYDVGAPTEPRVLLDQSRQAQCKHSAHSKRCDLLWSKGLFLVELVPWDILWALVSSNGSINIQNHPTY